MVYYNGRRTYEQNGWDKSRFGGGGNWSGVHLFYLATLAQGQGSTEHEYTDVHGVVDVVHTRELLRALDAELTLLPAPQPPVTHLLEGVHILRALIQSIIHPAAGRPVSA